MRHELSVTFCLSRLLTLSLSAPLAWGLRAINSLIASMPVPEVDRPVAGFGFPSASLKACAARIKREMAKWRP
jgi:hypothetical protein